MADINQALHNAAGRNAELLRTLGETDYAPTASDQQKKYIADLEAELKQNAQTLRKAEGHRAQELNDYEKYQKSVMKKFAYRVSGKKDEFSEKAAKEEREYIQALEDEHSARRVKDSLESKLSEAKDALNNLQPAVQRHDEAQKELDELYDSIFDGPTPSFPEEDRAEEAANKTLDAYRDVQAKLDAEKQLVQILDQAKGVMNNALRNLDDAHSASTWDMWGGGMMADCMERTSLGNAQTNVAELRSLMREAARTSQHAKDLGEMRIADGHMMSDIFFDNIFTDMAFHDKIKDSENNMAQARKNLYDQDEAAKQRIDDLKGQLSRAMGDLNNARTELQRVRTEAFQKAASQ